MKKCLYYRITSQECVFYGDFLEVFKHNKEPQRIELTDEFLATCAYVERDSVPVHKVIKDGQEFLIALEPEVKELIEAPIKSEIEFQKRHNASLMKNLDVYSDRISSFNQMTKWQKIKFIMKGNWV